MDQDLSSVNMNASRGQYLPFQGLQDVLRQFMDYLWISQCIFGLFTNLINLRVFKMIGLKDNVTITLFVLSVSDLAVVLLQFTSTIGITINKNYPNFVWPFNPTILIIWTGLYTTFFYRFSGYVSAFLALVRCMCVAKPLKFKSMFTALKTVKILLALFLFHSAFSIPMITNFRFVWSINPLTNSSFLTYKFSNYDKTATLIDDIFGTKIATWSSFFVIIISTVVLAYKLVRASHIRHLLRSTGPKSSPKPETVAVNEERNNGGVKKIKVVGPVGKQAPDESGIEDSAVQSEKRKAKGQGSTNGDGNHNTGGVRPSEESSSTVSSKDMQVIKSVTLVCSIYIAAYLPSIIVATIQLINPQFEMFGKWTNMYRMFTQISTVFMLLNTSMNIFVYLRYNSKYRRFFVATFCK